MKSKHLELFAIAWFCAAAFGFFGGIVAYHEMEIPWQQITCLISMSLWVGISIVSGIQRLEESKEVEDENSDPKVTVTVANRQVYYSHRNYEKSDWEVGTDIILGAAKAFEEIYGLTEEESFAKIEDLMKKLQKMRKEK